MKRLPLSILLFAALFLISHFAGGAVGASEMCSETGSVAGASSSLLSVVLGITAFATLLLIPRKPYALGSLPSGFWRMLGALFFDGFLATVGFSALLAMPMLLAEQSYTGQFHWSFARSYLRPTDWPLGLLAVAGSFMVIFVMRIRAFLVQKPSFGQYLMGFVVLTEGEAPTFGLALKRFGWATMYTLVWPVYLAYKAIKNLPKQSWDTRTNTKSVRFEYS